MVVYRFNMPIEEHLSPPPEKPEARHSLQDVAGFAFLPGIRISVA
jgi:hypothetical protein